jgi:hypothetical protein
MSSLLYPDQLIVMVTAGGSRDRGSTAGFKFGSHLLQSSSTVMPCVIYRNKGRITFRLNCNKERPLWGRSLICKWRAHIEGNSPVDAIKNLP